MAKQYTGKDRVAAAYKREYADRVPISMMLGAHCAELAGVTPEEYVTDFDKALKVAQVAQELYPSDVVPVPGNPLLSDVQAIRRRMKGESPAQHRLADKSALATLKIRPPQEDRFFGPLLKMCQRTAAAFPNEVVRATVGGPWTVAMELRGTEQLIYDTVDDPDFVHKVMRFTTELTKHRGVAVAQTGVEPSIADPSAASTVISPAMYRKWVKPYHEELFSYLRDKGVLCFVHICGNVEPVIPDLLSLPLDVISIDGPTSLKKMVEMSQKRVVVMGNVETSLFVEATKEQMEAAVKNCIDTAAKGSAYILAPGCAVPLNATHDRIRYFLDAAMKYGRYH